MPPRIVSPEILPDNKVTFRVYAKDATKVTLSGEWQTVLIQPSCSSERHRIVCDYSRSSKAWALWIYFHCRWCRHDWSEYVQSAATVPDTRVFSLSRCGIWSIVQKKGVPTEMYQKYGTILLSWNGRRYMSIHLQVMKKAIRNTPYFTCFTEQEWWGCMD